MYRQHFPDDPGMHNASGMPRNPTDPNLNSYYRPSTTLSFWERVKNSLMGILIGLGIIVFATGLLFWNEGRAVQTSKSLDEGMNAVTTISSTGRIHDKYNDKLVHMIGTLHTTEIIFDEIYGVAVHAVKLRRNVEMYQWVEIEHRREETSDDGSKREEVSYSYTTEWRGELVRSTSFYNRVGHHNPDSIPVKSKEFSAHSVHVGNYQLSKTLLAKINNYRRLNLKDKPKNDQAHLADNSYYHGQSHEESQIGDVRITYDYAGLSGKSSSSLGPPDKVSVVAKQVGNELLPYLTQAGDILELLHLGEHTATQIIGQEILHNTFLTWALRFLGWLLMFVAFGCLTSIITTLVDWVPLIRDLVALGVASLNAVLSICLSLTVIAAGWLRYRPWLSISLFIMAVAPFVISKIRQVVLMKPRTRTTRNWYD